jgi:hypothetical protein
MEVAMTEHAPELDVMHARQARRGLHALVILAVSLALALLTVFGSWAYFSGRLHTVEHAEEAVPAQVGGSPGS